jgi:hypothetical protein
MTATSTSPGSIARRWFGGCVILALSAVPLACGDSDEQSLCVVYAEFLDARAEIQAIDPTDKSAAEAVDAVDDYLSTVQRLRETDSTNSAAVDDLEAATKDALRTLESVDDEADYSTWAPLVEDSFEEAQKAADRVVDLYGPQCTPETES